jgi:putative ABC transport system substrate-binding protein
MSHQVQRREFVTLLGALAAAWPLVARAQSRPSRLIGVLMSGSEHDPLLQDYLAIFREGLKKLAWIEGTSIRYEYRWATPDTDSIQRFARELVALKPDALLAPNTPTTAALLQETRTIPIVFTNVADPVGGGFIGSLPRPGGNATGFIGMEAAISGKWLELLKEIAPPLTRVAVIFNPGTAPGGGSFYYPGIEAAARVFGVQVTKVPVHDAAEFDQVIANHAREPNGGVIAMPDTFMNGHRMEIAELALRHRLPSIYPYRFFAEAGGLMTYGNDQHDNYRRAAIYADRILKGIKPSDLPVQIPVKFELVVNVKTAKSIGLEVPPSFYWRADEVIE